MASKKRRKKARKTTKRRSSKKRASKKKRAGQIPLPILKRRLAKLSAVVARRSK